MAILLTIDTSTSTASICLSNDDQPVAFLTNQEQKDHASWLHPAIEEVVKQSGYALHDLKGIGITAGPGSYTGLRVGMATAKGLCYTLKIPLLAVNTLEAMAVVASTQSDADYLCPMLDARRMEVFTALYDKSLHPLVPPQALILSSSSFEEYLEKGKVLFFGDGHSKFSAIQTHPQAVFFDLDFSAKSICQIINKKYNLSEFADLTYQNPAYLKDFHVSSPMK